MKPSEIRRELLQQHAQIRVMSEVAQTVARRGSGPDELRACVVRLADAMRSHNEREEALLRDLIPSVDAWGTARAAIMTDEHVLEHARLDAALRGIPSASRPLAAAGVIALSHLLREHMDREENAFLCEDVLRDDVVIANQSGG